MLPGASKSGTREGSAEGAAGDGGTGRKRAAQEDEEGWPAAKKKNSSKFKGKHRGGVEGAGRASQFPIFDYLYMRYASWGWRQGWF